MKLSEASQLLLDCDFFSRGEYLAQLERALHTQSLTHIVTLNAEMVVEAQNNDVFRKSIAEAELKIPDGSSILWAREYLESRQFRSSYVFLVLSLLKHLFSKEQPLTGVDSIFDICSIVERIGGSVCLIGGEEEEANGTAKILRNTYPRLKISVNLQSTTYPPHSAIFVALGAPKQTLWIEQHRKTLEDSGIKIAIGVGGAFAMISGTLPRAPKLLRAYHLEWLWRLMLEPKRIRRIWNAVVVFPSIVHGYPH